MFAENIEHDEPVEWNETGPVDGEDIEERAAIVEFDGGLSMDVTRPVATEFQDRCLTMRQVTC